MPTLLSDRDGKSKTASAVDAEHYPEQNEIPQEHPAVSHPRDISDGPQVEEIRVRAYQLWLDRGCPDGTAEDDWYQAEQEVTGRSGIERLSDKLHEGSGSVQR